MTDLAAVEPVAGTVVRAETAAEDAAIEAWLRSMPNENTQRSFAYGIRLWRAHLQAHGRALIDPEPDRRRTTGPRRVDLDAFRNALLAEDKAPKTVDNRMIAVRSFYDFLVHEGVLELNPVRASRLLNQGPRRPTHALSPEEMQRLTAAARELDPGRRLLVLFQATTGCRVEEALTLTVGDLARSSGIPVATVTRKGGERQTIPVDPGVYEQLTAFTKGRPADALVLTRPDGGRLTYSGARWVLEKLGRKAGIVDERGNSRVHPHVLRASVITILLDGGAHVDHVQVLAGHKKTDTTRGYDRGAQKLRRIAHLAVTLGGLIEGDGDDPPSPEEGP